MQTRQLDLKFALMAARTLGENFQDDQNPVVDRQPDITLQITLLSRTQCLVKQDFLGAVCLGQRFDFIGFAGTDVESGIGGTPFADDLVCDHKTRRGGELTQFFQCVVKMGHAQIDANQNGTGTGIGLRRGGIQCWQKKPATVRWRVGGMTRQSVSVDCADANWTGRPGTMVEIACLYTI